MCWPRLLSPVLEQDTLSWHDRNVMLILPPWKVLEDSQYLWNWYDESLSWSPSNLSTLLRSCLRLTTLESVHKNDAFGCWVPYVRSILTKFPAYFHSAPLNLLCTCCVLHFAICDLVSHVLPVYFLPCMFYYTWPSAFTPVVTLCHQPWIANSTCNPFVFPCAQVGKNGMGQDNLYAKAIIVL